MMTLAKQKDLARCSTGEQNFYVPVLPAADRFERRWSVVVSRDGRRIFGLVRQECVADRVCRHLHSLGLFFYFVQQERQTIDFLL